MWKLNQQMDKNMTAQGNCFASQVNSNFDS